MDLKESTNQRLKVNSNTVCLIRKCTPGDIDEIVEMCREHAEFEKCSYSVKGKSEMLKHFLFAEEPVLHCLVAAAGSRLAGYAAYTYDFSTWNAAYYLHLDCLYLREYARGSGTGLALMREVAKEGLLNGIKEIQWQTPEFNTAAIEFYKKLGAVTKDKVRCMLFEKEIIKLLNI
ncbi:MAG: GNAT family N-acetyltransferase [Ignavibacteria bacterium]|nr:GNAT family N-acetyltransferase [Ignavibacteria bacterium]